MYETIEVQDQPPLATVALNRPEIRNAFNARMIAELTEAFRRLGSNAANRAIVLRGNGRSFSAGADVEWMRSSLDFSPSENIADALRMSDMFEAIDACPVPVIVRVHGAALGGGMGLIASGDIVVASNDAIFGFTEAKLGIIPAVISRFVVPKIGATWARALFLTAERFGADLAREIGLVHWIAPTGELDSLVESKIAELLSSGPGAPAEAKALIRSLTGRSDQEIRQLTAERIATLRAASEGQEGLRAFLEKRLPAWREDA